MKYIVIDISALDSPPYIDGDKLKLKHITGDIIVVDNDDSLADKIKSIQKTLKLRSFMFKENISSSKLASKLNVSASYITNLFRTTYISKDIEKELEKLFPGLFKEI